MSDQPLVSVIMPAYNAEQYISEAIQSVLDQDYSNFELLIINDGSIDSTESIILSFSDNRIRYFQQDNRGVSAARNVGLDNMKGEYFCFLDADDLMTKESLKVRLQMFRTDERIYYVDGKVEVMNEDLSQVERIWRPDFTGNPLIDLVKLTGKSFFGPTWMIRSNDFANIRFDRNLTHCEDLLFYMECSKSGQIYDHVDEVILKHREHGNTVMFDLKGLNKGYLYVGRKLRKWNDVSFYLWFRYWFRTRRIMVLSYL